ncbi:MAG: AMP-binding protein [Desulfocucumaceae bacterium]
MYFTVGKTLAEKAEANGSKIFLYYRNQRITYREINQMANSYAGGLIKLGIGKGDKVGLMMMNCPEFLYTFFALGKIGAVAVPVNAALRGQILQYQLSHSDQETLILDDIFTERLVPIKEGLDKLNRLIVRKVTGESAAVPGIETLSIDSLRSGDEGEPEVSVSPRDPAAIMYTSGTTGPSKGALIPHQYLVVSGKDNFDQRGSRKDDIFYTCLPLFHGNALGLTVMPALAGDASVALGERFTAAGFWDEIRSFGATQFNYLGAMVTILLKQEQRVDDRDNPVRIALGAAAPANMIPLFEERFGVKLMEGYGLTESGVVCTMTHDDIKHGSLGRASSNYEVKIFDDDDNEAYEGVIGEIVSRPLRPFSMMTEYYKMPEKTLEAFRNLWFHTGDYGYRGSDGYFYFVDRKKDAIRRRGENISSFEVERAVNMHPAVLESAAVAVPSELGEDDVKIVVVLKPGQSLAEEDLLAYCEENMAYFMIPRYVEFRPSLPKTQTERVEKHRLRAEGITGETWDREKAGYRLKR